MISLQISLLCLGLAGTLALQSQETLLLKSLGLKAKPSPKTFAPVPPLLWKMFKGRSQALPAGKESQGPCWVEEFNVPGNIIRVFPDQGRFIHHKESPSWLCLHKRLYFNFSALDEGEMLTMARLEVRFGRNWYWAASPSRPFELSLYKATRMALSGMSAHAHNREVLLEQSFVHLHKSFAFDLTQVADAWRAPARNLGLILEIGVPALPEGDFCSGVDSFLETSLLAVSLAPSPCKSPRKKRSAYYVPLAAGNVCKPRRLYISFSDVGWENWIIAPQGYMANYCLGECPFPLTEELNSTNHAILQTIVHSLDPEGTPQPCCVPVRLSPISILYYDNDDNVVLRHYEDMVVDECGCR